jgi:UDP-N-acetyl-D-mannosaminuronate dehydrogenase
VVTSANPPDRPLETLDVPASGPTTTSPEADVLVIGLGEIGNPLLGLLSKSHRAAGRDIEDRSFRNVQILHLCYPFGEGFVRSASRYVSMYEPELVIVNSTVVPGTSRAICEETGTKTVYSPVRGKHLKMGNELLRYAKFLAGSSPDAVALADKHFTDVGIRTRHMSSFEVLELAKLLETTYFGVLVAWAQEMDRYGEALGTDYWEALQFLDEIDFLPHARFEPGYIGGHCVMPNLGLLAQVRESPFIDAIRQSNAQREAEWQKMGRALSERLSPRANE